ncbi:vitamin B12 dependent-methionine synthase activation domain-containing protein [uncultured Bacteroides sp.]|uniref:vitamin B12 dependent-methionine synthase activation domain-containing protein n=1 Tax=uncultured Bacteroides sp. TaxID=162156 RepID=UPI0025E06539|nr:vitamin B12 dependent-methionine synthase activation domain-containing protein [uncultured Bacteroides sp.]
MLEQRQIGLRSLDFSEEDIYRAMGYRDTVPDDTVCSFIKEVQAEISSLCVPRYMYQILEARQVAGKRIQAGGVEFSPGGIIGSYLSGLSHICLFVATAGREYDAYLHRLKTQGDIMKEYVADSIGSVIAEACVTLIDKELEANSELRHSLPYSPGYCGWNICEQQKLFSLFPPQPCGITLSDSFLMSPVKSVSGFFGLGKELLPQPYRCEICTNKHCYKRKEK